MASWNSIPLEVTYQVMGWLAFVSWSIGGFPQIILNFRRKSVVGLNLDYEILNLTKQWSYLIYNSSLFFSPVIQKQYFEKYGFGQMIPVAANDVAFSTYAVIMNAIVIYQIAIYERGSQKVSKYAIGIVSVVGFSAAVCFFIALPSQSWLWLISIFKYLDLTSVLTENPYILMSHLRCLLYGKVYCHFVVYSIVKYHPLQGSFKRSSVQVCLTIIKYFPQALMNFMRKSTDGFSIGSVLLDFSGGVFNYSQMAVQSIDQGSFVNFYGNIGKVLISLVTIFYDSILMCQHYVLYPDKKGLTSSKDYEEIKQPLILASPIDQQIKGSVKSSDQPPAEEFCDV